MKSKLHHFFIYFFAVLIPPFIFGTLFSFQTLMNLLYYNRSEPLQQVITPLPTPKALNSNKLNAAILLSNQATQTSEALLAFYELKSKSNLNVFTVAPIREPVPTTQPVSILPDYSFENAPKINVLILPSVTNFTEPKITTWVNKNISNAQLIITLGEGIRLLPQSFLNNKTVTSHFLSQQDLQEKLPDTIIDTKNQWIKDGKLLSSSGVFSTQQTIQKALQILKQSKFSQSSTEINPLQLEQEFKIKEFFYLFLHAGFDWFPNSMGVYLYNGVSEGHVATLIDSFPRSIHHRVVTFAEKRNYITTENGMTLIPAVSYEKTPKLDTLIIPSGKSSITPDPDFKEHAQEVVSFYNSLSSPNLTYNTMNFLAQKLGSPGTELVAKLTNFNQKIDIPSLPIAFSLFLRPLFLSLLGVIGVRFFTMRARKRKNQH